MATLHLLMACFRDVGWDHADTTNEALHLLTRTPMPPGVFRSLFRQQPSGPEIDGPRSFHSMEYTMTGTPLRTAAIIDDSFDIGAANHIAPAGSIAALATEPSRAYVLGAAAAPELGHLAVLEQAIQEDAPMRLRPKTDLGTIILHWLLVSALLGAIATGLNIASAAPGSDWTAALHGMLPRSWICHFWSALVLIVVAIIYPIYMRRAALVPRVRLDRVRFDAMRLRGLAHSRYQWAAVNVVLNWACYLSVLTEILSGGLLYFDRGSAVIIEIHWLATWTIIAIAPVHVLAHFAFGGIAQLLRLFRPAQRPPLQLR